MFVRKKKNHSGKISIQIVDKSSGKYRVVKTIGCSDNEEQINALFKSAREEIHRLKKQFQIDFEFGDGEIFFERVAQSIKEIQLIGPELLLGKIFDEIGFYKIKDELFRHLVIARLVYPASKLKTADYLLKYKSVVYGVQQIYRYLDKLHKQQQTLIQQISYRHTLKLLNGKISVVFYDVTTLYFEAEDEDDIRKTGFSKDGKHQHPQILLGLLVSIGGYPLAYEIFEGNKFEGHTMLPILEAFKSKYQLQRLVIIADAGLLSKENIAMLKEKKYEFILGGRIKNESNTVKEKILRLSLPDGASSIIEKNDDTKLIVSYALTRAKKDAQNRSRGLKKLETALAKGKLTKQHINNKGYNKYLKLEGNISISIDYDKFKTDARWDGLKGYITNTSLGKEEIIENYKHLWQIEKAFRISKTDLRIRPVYHHLKRRIESHICIAFTAYKIYKELERQLKAKNIHLSPEKAIEILKTIYGLQIQNPQTQEIKIKVFAKKPEQLELLKNFGCPCV
ncbi:IS1634 family transposase [Flavobacterium sp.]|uniref:IS1634 family transposase n=1 Tax=Flavobacterium sp. TaxID=239 RepID=UPI002B4B00F1|nr:IS1634 family transposase [Flavobacterium sp.]HLF51180.1 IS1634 family transposase [Flavobacterium sp.]